MINKIKNHIILNKSKYLLGILLGFSLLVRIWYSSRDSLIWWDEAVYIDMGKYLATMGQIGFWEFFRPPALPIFYAIIYKLHLPLIFFGKSIVVLASVGLIYLVYLLAEKIKNGTGLYAGLFLSITPVFFYFSKIPLSDILSAFFAILALYFFINKRDFISGIFVGIAFLSRFPQGLVLVPILFSLLYREYNKGEEDYFKRIFYSGLKIIAGFFVLVIPYLISNYFFYGSMFEPIQYANQIIARYNFLYFKGFWYYLNEFWQIAPFLFFSAFSLIIVAFQFKKKSIKNVSLVSIFITTVVFCTYFFLQMHKELRYSIAFIPYLAVLSGVGFAWILEKAVEKNVLKIIFMIGIIFFLFKAKPYILYSEIDPYKDFYSYFLDKKGIYISTTPVPAAVGNILIPELFESYNAERGFNEVLNRRLNQIDGVIMSSSDIFCADKAIDGNCDKEISNIYKRLKQADFKQVYSENIGVYNASVFEKIK